MNNLQRTDEWFNDRIGKVTASNFGRVMTNSKPPGKISQTAWGYLQEIIAGILTGAGSELQTDAIQHGIDSEELAVYDYEKRKFVEVELVGFLPYEGKNPLFKKYVGCSPDGLVGKDGGLEVKCPDTKTFVAYMMKPQIPKGHYAQMQGSMLVTDRKWWDYVVYDPRIKDPKKQMIITRVYRDDVFIEKLKSYLVNFCAELEFQLKSLNINIEDFQEVPSV